MLPEDGIVTLGPCHENTAQFLVKIGKKIFVFRSEMFKGLAPALQTTQEKEVEK